MLTNVKLYAIICLQTNRSRKCGCASILKMHPCQQPAYKERNETNCCWQVIPWRLCQIQSEKEVDTILRKFAIFIA